jgi:hypothetical protein
MIQKYLVKLRAGLKLVLWTVVLEPEKATHDIPGIVITSQGHEIGV